jgi:EmrB/QacA subfamily drug resistance transporter
MRKPAAHRNDQAREDQTAPGFEAAHRWLLLAIGLGNTLAPLNSTMIAVALPRIQGDLDVSVTQTAWLVTIYLAAMAAGQPIGGRIGDLFGRRRVYLFGLVWFAAASVACAFAPNLLVLVIFRTQQALAGALTFPNGAAIVREVIPPGRRGSAFGIIGMAVATAAAIGPPLGGILVHAFGWQAIFWANVPIIALALALNIRHLPQPRPTDRARPAFDTTGSILFALSLSGLIALPALLRDDRVAPAALALIVTLGLAAAFVRCELRVEHPVVDIRFFARRAFAAACASIALSNSVMYVTLLALPLYMTEIRGDSERVVGLTLMAMSALAAVTGPVGGRMTDTRGRWAPAVAGGVGLLAGAAILAGAIDSGLLPIVIGLTVMGLGVGIQGAPVQTAAVESAPLAQAGSAAGIFSTSRYVGSVIGATLLAIIFATDPGPGDSNRFQMLFVGLTVVAVVGILVNTQVSSPAQHGPPDS